ncbi:MAG: hypothetical protein RIR02_240 [Pseudomonadota bacterium]|jgi:dinuclear metal center YbgI/SA1388 family protein
MKNKSVERDELAKYLAAALDINRFRDYCPNGLQVQGAASVKHMVTGVTASLALLEAAHAAGADTVLVHHGYFWRGEDPRVVGTFHKRLKFLLEHDMNLFAYHLPLDAHAEWGNNVQLGKLLGLTINRYFGEQDLGCVADVNNAVSTVGDLQTKIEKILGRSPLLIGDVAKNLNTIAWCTGAAQQSFAEAIAAGADVYISGEISEQTVHLARESGVAYLACGHHATERYGVQAIGQHCASQFGISHQFIDIPNPV